MRVLLGVFLAALPAATAFAGGGDVQVVVKFKGDADPGTVTARGGLVVATIDRAGAVVARIAPRRLAALRASPKVSYVEEDGICEALGKGGNGNRPGGGTPSDPVQSTPWGVTKVLPGGATETGSGVKVAVVDTGIDLTHPDLAANVVADVSFVGGRGGNSGDDDNGHGSHVAGTIAAIDNSIGVVGIAPAAGLYAVKVLDRRGSGTWSAVASGVLWCADNGIHVVNMSLGGSSSSTTLSDACATAADAGVLLLAAAGNEGDGSIATSEISYPAAYASVVSVGATTSTDTLASFSNTNSDVEVSAPGVQVPSTYKDGGYATLSGTSMACPHAVGVAALLWGAATSPTATTVRAALRSSVVDLGATGRDNGYGYGRVTYSD